MAAVALKMPSSYVPVEAEEMEYIEGGEILYGYWVDCVMTRQSFIIMTRTLLFVASFGRVIVGAKNTVLGSVTKTNDQIAKAVLKNASDASKNNIIAYIISLQSILGLDINGFIGRIFDACVDPLDGVRGNGYHYSYYIPCCN